MAQVNQTLKSKLAENRLLGRLVPEIDLIAEHVDEMFASLLKPLNFVGPPPSEKEMRASIAESLQLLPVTDSEFDAEKKSRIKYQEMAYAAMSFIDSILGLNARQGTGTTVDNFHSNLALARTARSDRAKDQALRDFVVDAGRCSELSPGSNTRVVRIEYLKALLPRYGVVDHDHPSKMSADALDSGAIAEADKGMNELKSALDAKRPTESDMAAGNFSGHHVIDRSPDRPQCQPPGWKMPETWDDYEMCCRYSYNGGYSTVATQGAFRAGMTTIFNMLRREFKSPAECRK